MSATAAGSSTKIELGADTEDVFEDTQSGAGPAALAAAHPAGKAGAATASKFCVKNVLTTPVAKL